MAEIFGQKSTSKIPKFEEILGKNSKIRLFFFKCGWGSVKMSEYQKQIFSHIIKALKLILGSKMILNGPKWILKRVHIFQIWGKIQKKIFHIFGKDFSVKKWEKKKFKKKCFLIFFEKQNTFLTVFNLILFFFRGKGLTKIYVFPSY